MFEDFSTTFFIVAISILFICLFIILLSIYFSESGIKENQKQFCNPSKADPEIDNNFPIKEEPIQQRVVCSAMRSVSGKLFISIRHFDNYTHRTFDRYNESEIKMWAHAEQGFVDQFGTFLTRREAFDIAEAAGQIIHHVGTEHTRKLYSENLY